MNCGLAGETADPGNLPSGCAFHPRCPECFAPCAQLRPELKDEEAADCERPAHLVACHLRDGRGAGLPGGGIG
jgi:ABC-type dipeptide/oligopeptide/nickel transport system ATPase component